MRNCSMSSMMLNPYLCWFTTSPQFLLVTSCYFYTLHFASVSL